MNVSDIILKESKERKITLYRISLDLGMSKSWLYNVLRRRDINCNTLGRLLEYFNLNLIAEDDLGIKTVFPNENTGRVVLNYIDNERINQSMIKAKLGKLCGRSGTWTTPSLNQAGTNVATMVRMGNALNVKFYINKEQIT